MFFIGKAIYLVTWEESPSLKGRSFGVGTGHEIPLEEAQDAFGVMFHKNSGVSEVDFLASRVTMKVRKRQWCVPTGTGAGST